MDLAAQLEHLDRLLLSTVRTSFPGSLTDEEKAATNAFLVLAHAVLEEHIEEAFRRHYERLVGWLDAPMVPLEVARLAFVLPSLVAENDKKSYRNRSLESVSKAARRKFTAEVRANNGIKQDNIAKLAELVGLDWGKLESALGTQLADLTSFGGKRGEAGHLSPYSEKAVVITRETYPEQVREWVGAAREACLELCNYLIAQLHEQEPLSIIVDWDGN